MLWGPDIVGLATQRERMTVSRRRILQTLAIGAGAATFAPVLRQWRVRDVKAASSPPKRLMIFFHQNGFRDLAVDQLPVIDPVNFKLGTMSSPLERHRQDLVVLSTLSQGIGTSSHNVGYNGMLTGQPVTDTPRKGGGISLDRQLAKVVGSVATPALPNLHLGLATITEGSSFDENGTLVRPNPDPYKAYDSVFGSLQLGGAPAASTPDNRSVLRKSVLDSVSSDLADFTRRLGPEDKIRADAQLDAIRALEARLQANVSVLSNGACAKPVIPGGISIDGDNDGKFIPLKTKAQLDLIFNAFSCDLTRIATYYLESQNNDNIHANFDPVNMPDANWHGLSHAKNGAEYDAFVRAQNFAYEQAAQFADRLKATPEGDGSMLDNTLMLVCTEISIAHACSSYVWYTIGGKNLGVAGGRLLKFDGASHWQFLTSLQNALGVPGNFGQASGPLPGFLA